MSCGQGILPMTAQKDKCAARAGVALYFYSLAGAGGAERMICQLAGALVARNQRVLLVSWDAPDTTAYYPIHPSVQWLRLGFQNGMFDKFRRIRVLSAQLKAHGIRTFAGFVMSADRTVYIAARLGGVRLIVAERNAPVMYWMRYNGWRRLMCFAWMRLADRVVVQMPRFVEAYPQSLRQRIEVIANPVPQVSRQACPAARNSAGRFILLCVSRLDHAQKRVECLIRAFARVAATHPEWDLRIVGDGPEEARLRGIVGELGLTNRVGIEPARKDVFEVYVQAHLFAIPSLWEGFPNALAEALAHGLPAVGFAEAQGVADLIGADAGWLAPGLDDEFSLARTLGQAMTGGEERARRGGAAIRKMAAFLPEAQFDRWAEVIEAAGKESAP
jgi:glycosyltransferase involved in cell wall biosynthesis